MPDALQAEQNLGLPPTRPLLEEATRRYQDTNVAQERLLQRHAGERRNVFCVADQDQSIYAFRGTEIDHMLRFDERWGAARYDLPVNYRSAAPVVDLLTSVIRRNVRYAPRQGVCAPHKIARRRSSAAPSATTPRRQTGSRARSPLCGRKASLSDRSQCLHGRSRRSARGSHTPCGPTGSRSIHRSRRSFTRARTRFFRISSRTSGSAAGEVESATGDAPGCPYEHHSLRPPGAP
jgi:UvrD/REP helicase N-terminal domain